MSKPPPLPNLRYDFRDSVIQGVKLGPRREVTLRIGLWPVRGGRRVTIWRGGEGDCVDLRFGGIDDFEIVAAFFGESSSLESLHYLRLKPESRPGRVVVQMQWDRIGAELQVRCSSLTVTNHLPPDSNIGDQICDGNSQYNHAKKDPAE